jgi:phosphatidylserine/phosphatidylglycerophosphate/cardiolipin synthase-like enzyme
VLSGFLACCAACFGSAANAGDALPSWNDGAAKTAILEFVAAVTEEGGRDYVEPAERIAVFDHDGTMWVEYPMYTQILFAFDRVKTLAPQDPEWKTMLLHTKSMTLDGDVTLIGSANMDRRSFDLNYENNILLYDEALTAEMRARQETYLASSNEVTMADVEAWPVGRRLWHNTIAMLGPLL